MARGQVGFGTAVQTAFFCQLFTQVSMKAMPVQPSSKLADMTGRS